MLGREGGEGREGGGREGEGGGYWSKSGGGREGKRKNNYVMLYCKSGNCNNWQRERSE